MDVKFNYSIENISKEDMENLFSCITNVMTLVKESSTDEFERTHLHNEIVDLKSKISDLERENKSLKIAIENAELDAKLRASVDKPAKKKPTVEDFKEV